MRKEMRLWIPDSEWEETGPDELPWLRCLGPIIDINGVPHHCEAWAVDYDDHGVQNIVSHTWSEEPTQAIYTLNGQCLATIKIRGREYVVVIYPHGV